jgi:hypothetical protein
MNACSGTETRSSLSNFLLEYIETGFHVLKIADTGDARVNTKIAQRVRHILVEVRKWNRQIEDAEELERIQHRADDLESAVLSCDPGSPARQRTLQLPPKHT